MRLEDLEVGETYVIWVYTGTSYEATGRIDHNDPVKVRVVKLGRVRAKIERVAQPERGASWVHPSVLQPHDGTW